MYLRDSKKDDVVDLRYIPVHVAYATYKMLMKLSDEQDMGLLQEKCLEKILDFMRWDNLYPKIEDKLGYMIFSIIKNHCFVDGNKRISLALAAFFLKINGLDYLTIKFIREMENIIYERARGNIDRKLLIRCISSIIEERDDEVLKIEILKILNNSQKD